MQRTFFQPFLLCLVCAVVLTGDLRARIGESRPEFERRLLQPDTGRFMTRDRTAGPGREAEEKRRQPFNAVRAYFPEDVYERQYWKSAIPHTLSNEDGWRVHVFYQDGVSVFEAYQRVGQPLNEFEIQNLLSLNQGDSSWRLVDDESAREISAIGCGYALENDQCRARVEGNWLLIFSTQFDQGIQTRIRASREANAEAEAERRARWKREAAGSTGGF